MMDKLTLKIKENKWLTILIILNIMIFIAFGYRLLNDHSQPEYVIKVPDCPTVPDCPKINSDDCYVKILNDVNNIETIKGVLKN